MPTGSLFVSNVDGRFSGRSTGRTTDRTETSRTDRSENMRKSWLDPLGGKGDNYKKRRPHRDPRQMGTSTNSTGAMVTRRERGKGGKPVIDYGNGRKGVPLTVRAWNPQETERNFNTSKNAPFVPGKEDPNYFDRRKNTLHQCSRTERSYRTNNTAGVKGRPGYDCSDSLKEICSKQQEYANCFSRK